MIKWALILIVITGFVNSCNPYKYSLLSSGYEDFLEGHILTHFETVQKINHNTVKIKPGGITSIRKTNLTNFIFEANVRSDSPLAVNIFLRNVRNEFNGSRGIRIELRDKGWNIFEDDMLKLSKSHDLAQSQIKAIHDLHYIKFVSEGQALVIETDCFPQTSWNSDLTLTEYIIIQNLSSDDLILSGIRISESLK